jgi:hypothetical protein
MMTLSSFALAQNEPVLLGEFTAWQAYKVDDPAGNLCFAVSQAEEANPNSQMNRSSYLYLSTRPLEGIAEELNIVAGFEFAPQQIATLSVDGKSYEIITEGSEAWLVDNSLAARLADGIRAGARLVLEAMNAQGEKVTLVFSLKGATKATRAAAGC